MKNERQVVKLVKTLQPVKLMYLSVEDGGEGVRDLVGHLKGKLRNNNRVSLSLSPSPSLPPLSPPPYISLPPHPLSLSPLPHLQYYHNITHFTCIHTIPYNYNIINYGTHIYIHTRLSTYPLSLMYLSVEDGGEGVRDLVGHLKGKLRNNDRLSLSPSPSLPPLSLSPPPISPSLPPPPFLSLPSLTYSIIIISHISHAYTLYHI